MSKKVSKKILFNEMTDIQKQCRSPYKSPTFIKNELPIFTYVSQFVTKKKKSACTDDSAPNLIWNSDMGKYCCSSDEPHLIDVMQKIIDAIITQVENSCDQRILDKYKQHINILIRNYITLYKRYLKEYEEKTDEEEINSIAEGIRAELVSYTSNVRPWGEQSESCDIGEDDEELMAQLRLAESHAPRARPSEFFATHGGRGISKSRTTRTTRRTRRTTKNN
jgi:hypothetical protein